MNSNEFHQYIYPAIFAQSGDEVAVSFPDLGLVVDGNTVEEAFLFAKDYLRVYFSYSHKFDIEASPPSFFNDIAKLYPNNNVMLIDVILTPNDIKKS